MSVHSPVGMLVITDLKYKIKISVFLGWVVVVVVVVVVGGGGV